MDPRVRKLAKLMINYSLNLKKGQFLSPWEIAPRVNVLRESGAKEIWITERGSSFGYQRLVNDFRVVPITQRDAPIIYNAVMELA